MTVFIRQYLVGKQKSQRTAKRISAVVFSLTICSMSPTAFADITIGGACTGGAQNAQSTDGNNAVCVSSTWQYPAYTFQSVAASAGASCSGTTAGTVRYNSTLAGVEFCNGSVWVQLQAIASTPSISAPSGSGYFVMSAGTWNGNLGQLEGADAKCLADLTTNTGWMGYSTANSNGQLVADKVHAFLCSFNNTQGCTNLMPSTTYYFSDASNGSSGGASFTTDSSGIGPGDASNWSGATYFGASYTCGRVPVKQPIIAIGKIILKLAAAGNVGVGLLVQEPIADMAAQTARHRHDGKISMGVVPA